MVPGQEPFGREAFAAAAGYEGMRIEGKSDIRELQVLGDWAYMRSYLQVFVTPPSGDATQRTGYTLTIPAWRRRQWRLARHASTCSAA